MRKVFALAIVLLGALACSLISPTGIHEPEGKLVYPDEAHVDLSDVTITNFNTPENQSILQRYFAGNGRWEVRQERGLPYAVRLEKVDGEYQTSLNGYYSEHKEDGSVYQTRVLVSFKEPYGYGNLNDRITRSNAGDVDVELVVADSFPGKPGYTSYLIVDGGGIYIEIYDQAPQIERVFTQKAYNEVSNELSAVLENLDEIVAIGIMPLDEFYLGEFPTTPYFNVNDGMQRGIYLLDAAVNPTAPGILYVKVFNTKSGERLSADRVTPASTRLAAWSEGGVTYFPYQSEITIYEGDWSTEFEARFELWHKDEFGHETKLLETTRLVYGWQR